MSLFKRYPPYNSGDLAVTIVKLWMGKVNHEVEAGTVCLILRPLYSENEYMWQYYSVLINDKIEEVGEYDLKPIKKKVN